MLMLMGIDSFGPIPHHWKKRPRLAASQAPVFDAKSASLGDPPWEEYGDA